MLDVAAVAGLVWDNCLGGRLRTRLERSLGSDARGQVLFLAGMHDLGKACPGFQGRIPELSQVIALPFSVNDQVRPHGFASARVLEDALGSASGWSALAQIAGGHHGVFPRSSDLCMGRDTLGNNCWTRARRELLELFAATISFKLRADTRAGIEVTDPALVPTLAGFVSVVDWIGSNQDHFPCVAEVGGNPQIGPSEYWLVAKRQAREALETLGWLPVVGFAGETSFGGVFRGLEPNVLQSAVAKAVTAQTGPFLIIVEAPMGQGKTEAALYAADVAMCRNYARGLYVAMPTQATSNAMFGRVLDSYLRHRGHQGRLNVQLVHGDALLANLSRVREGEISEYALMDVGEGADLEAQSWFTAKKRPLLAPFGVGTIDQTLLSVLQTKHWFVRLFGLAAKVVVLDEVHAYDTYMTTILERLLHWLAEVESTVILLSATLPDAKRRALVMAYSGSEEPGYLRYPRITVAKPRVYPACQAEAAPTCAEIPMEHAHSMEVGFASTDLPTLAGSLSCALECGGCAAVICNTVDRAIQVHRFLEERLRDCRCLLFHARTLQMWRREREEEVLRLFGKRSPQEKDSDGFFANPDRPVRAVLVATQVIEQSLDLDFDLLVSEMAPIDLLLQRSGRLHRHPRRRPAGLETPRLVVLCDAAKTGPPPDSFGEDLEAVYERFILLRTWHALRGRRKIELPGEIESLVESVYAEPSLANGEGWEMTLAEAKDQSESRRAESEKAARGLLVSTPNRPSDLLEHFNSQLGDDEDPAVHRTVRAATREGDPSIAVVMMPASTVLTDRPEPAEVRWLLDRLVRVSRRGVFRALLTEGETPREWARDAHLRHARLLRLDDFGQGRVGEYVLAADEGMGVTFEKHGTKKDGDSG